MNNLTNEELKNILVLIDRASIMGQEATATAMLQQKISRMITDEPLKSVGEKEDEKRKTDK